MKNNWNYFERPPLVGLRSSLAPAKPKNLNNDYNTNKVTHLQRTNQSFSYKNSLNLKSNLARSNSIYQKNNLSDYKINSSNEILNDLSVNVPKLERQTSLSNMNKLYLARIRTSNHATPDSAYATLTNSSSGVDNLQQINEFTLNDNRKSIKDNDFDSSYFSLEKPSEVKFDDSFLGSIDENSRTYSSKEYKSVDTQTSQNSFECVCRKGSSMKRSDTLYFKNPNSSKFKIAEKDERKDGSAWVMLNTNKYEVNLNRARSFVTTNTSTNSTDHRHHLNHLVRIERNLNQENNSEKKDQKSKSTLKRSTFTLNSKSSSRPKSRSEATQSMQSSSMAFDRMNIDELGRYIDDLRAKFRLKTGLNYNIAEIEETPAVSDVHSDFSNDAHVESSFINFTESYDLSDLQNRSSHKPFYITNSEDKIFKIPYYESSIESVSETLEMCSSLKTSTNRESTKASIKHSKNSKHSHQRFIADINMNNDTLNEITELSD